MSGKTNNFGKFPYFKSIFLSSALVNITDVLSDRLVWSVLYHSYQWQNGANEIPYPIDIQSMGENLQLTFQPIFADNPQNIQAFEVSVNIIGCVTKGLSFFFCSNF